MGASASWASRRLTDRLIQQALLQVLQPLIDPTFSDHSYGFRPGRRAHDAVKAARAYVQSGKPVVVDVDLAKFFDRVNHDILIDRLREAYRRCRSDPTDPGVPERWDHGWRGGGGDRHLGTPQGGPLSPLLANVLLDEDGPGVGGARATASRATLTTAMSTWAASRPDERVMAWLRKLYA